MASLLTLLCATPLVAQEKDKLCTDIQNRPMRVGQWADYRWTGGRTNGSTMRMALVGTENVGNTPHYWYEVAFNDAARGSGKTIIQILVPGLGFQASSVKSLILKSGTEPAMRMSEEAVRMMGSRMGQNFATEFAHKCQETEVVGWEQVTVPAGTFRALHVRHTGEGTDAWLLSDLYFGLLKATLKDGSSMELSGRGSDAKSSITETPTLMPFPR
ncbi:MAG TPA: hypothetical protein VN803_11205 [Gemmatimonadales bacterium]|nr:hypothetical protein [Gemmatimonadales bacterium]